MAAGDIDRLRTILPMARPANGREAYTLEQFLDELVGPAGAVRPVKVHKRRVRYTVGGCMAEVSDVVADGRATRTIAIESTDAAAVIAAIHSVGLGGYLNTNYPRGLAALRDGRAARYATIDVGTNSVKFHIGERDPDGAWTTVLDRAEVTRLGEGLAETGAISPAALERTAEAIKAMAEEARREGVLAVAAVGTAGLRAATNQADVLAVIRERSGVEVEVIPGDEEGRLAYQAVQSSLATTAHALVVFDTGGGSSQFTFGRDGQIQEQFSLPVGAVEYTERFGLAGTVSEARLQEALAAIAADLARIHGRPAPDALVGMGGAITNLTAIMHSLAVYDPDVVQGSVLSRAEIDRQIELFRSRDIAGRREIVGLQPKRADVILAGACIVRTVMAALGQSALTVSDRGLRHGLLLERFGP
jgi:exopolyphosphatase/guanosine-5'-triphosphate,3'-diphosphate pyrophosphatase